MHTDTLSLLIQKAAEARTKSYAPDSDFSVGAALLTADGSIFTGANIESATHTPTVCAERVAFFSAIHAGHRDFTAIAIVGGSNQRPVDTFCPPCGVCLQVMSEFCKGDFSVILTDGKSRRVLTLDEVLPHRFSLGV